MSLTLLKEQLRRPLQVIRLAAGGAILCLSIQGCNDRAFVEPLPPEEELTIPAEGGKLSVSPGLRGVESMTIVKADLGSAPDHAVIYNISLEGDTLGILADAAAPVPGTIAIDWPNLSFRATANADGRVEIVSGRSLYQATQNIMVNLHSSGGATYTIPVRISGIEPLKGVDIDYPYSFGEYPDEEEEFLTSRRYTNLTYDTATIILHPYELARIRVTFTPDNPYLPVIAGSPLPIPSPGPESEGYHPGMYGLEAPYLPGREETYPVTGADEAVRIKLPPRVSRRYHTFLRRRSVVGFYRVTLESPSLSRPVISEGHVEVNVPVGYIIGYSEDPLVEP